MGPYSEKLQIHRAAAIQRLLETNPQLSDEVKHIWQKHAINLAVNEDEYNARVKSVYTEIRNNQTKGWMS